MDVLLGKKDPYSPIEIYDVICPWSDVKVLIMELELQHASSICDATSSGAYPQPFVTGHTFFSKIPANIPHVSLLNI